MKKFYLLLIMLVFLATSCGAVRYVDYDSGYGVETVSYSSSYYTVMVYEGGVLLESYSPARIISRDGLIGGYTRVTLDIGGVLVTVSGSTILLYPVGYPDSLYLLYGTSYYRWHDRWNRFIISPRPPRPPRGHQAPPPPREPRRDEPRPRPRPNDRPQQGQPNVRPQGQPGNQPAPRPNNNQPNQRPNDNQPNVRRNNNSQPSARPNNQSSPSVTRPSTQSAPRGNSGGGGGGRSSGPSNSGSSSSGRGGRGR